MTDHIDHFLREILKLTRFLQITGIPGIDNTYQITTVVVSGTTYSSLSASHCQTRKNSLILPMQHIKLSILIKTALIVLIQALIGVFDACKIRNTPVYRFKKSYHRQKCPVKSRNMIKIERKLGSTASNLFTVFHQFFYTTYLRERRSHRTNTPCSDLLCMLCQATTRLHASTTHMNNYFKIFRRYFDPAFRQLHALFFGEHIAFTR